MSTDSPYKLSLRVRDRPGAAPKTFAFKLQTKAAEATNTIAKELWDRSAKDAKIFDLVLPPDLSKKRYGRVVPKDGRLCDERMGKEYVYELWRQARMVRVGVCRNRDSDVDVVLECGTEFRKMLPMLRRIFFQEKDDEEAGQEFACLCVARRGQDISTKWVSVNKTLTSQGIRDDSLLILFPITVITKYLRPEYYTPADKEGVLYLKKPKRFKKKGTLSRRRQKGGEIKVHCVVKGPMLFYWKGSDPDRDSKPPKGAICLDHQQITVNEEGQSRSFSLQRDPHLFVDSDDEEEDAKFDDNFCVFSAQKSDDIQTWVDAIQPMCVNSESTKVFGVDLDVVMRRQSETDAVPSALRKMIQYIYKYGIDTEGIFRVCGGVKAMEECRRAFDKGVDVDVAEMTGGDVHAVAGMLKLYLRLLPEPILTYDLYDCFVAAHSHLSVIRPENEVVVRKMVELVADVPEQNYRVLRCVLEFLSQVAKHSDKNLMPLSNLATVFGPNLLRERADPLTQSFSSNSNNNSSNSGMSASMSGMMALAAGATSVDNIAAFRDSHVITEIVETLIANQAEIFDQVEQRKKERAVREKREAMGMMVDDENDQDNNTNDDAKKKKKKADATDSGTHAKTKKTKKKGDKLQEQGEGSSSTLKLQVEDYQTQTASSVNGAQSAHNGADSAGDKKASKKKGDKKKQKKKAEETKKKKKKGETPAKGRAHQSTAGASLSSPRSVPDSVPSGGVDEDDYNDEMYG